MEKLQKNSKRRGVAVVEFLFAAPAFFVLIFFVVEIALIWSDRHIMRMAAYRAARTVVKMRADGSPNAELCWQGAIDPAVNPKDAAIIKAARLSAAKVMSVVTPTVTQMLSEYGIAASSIAGGESLGATLERQIKEQVSEDFGGGIIGGLQQIMKNPYVHAIYRMMNGLPSAWSTVELECSNIKFPATGGTSENNGVEIRLTYHRSAKMPYVGNIMWLMRQLQEVYSRFNLKFSGTEGMMRVNPLNYGLEFQVSTDDALYNAALIDLTKSLKELAEKNVNKVGKTIEDATKPLGDISPELGEIGNSMSRIFDEKAVLARKGIDDFVGASAGTINSIGEAAINMFVKFPNFHKTVPISVSVRTPNYSQAFVNTGNAWKGRAVAVGHFSDKPDKNLPDLAHALGETMDAGSPPHGPKGNGLPYVK